MSLSLAVAPFNQFNRFVLHRVPLSSALSSRVCTTRSDVYPKNYALNLCSHYQTQLQTISNTCLMRFLCNSKNMFVMKMKEGKKWNEGLINSTSQNFIFVDRRFNRLLQLKAHHFQLLGILQIQLLGSLLQLQVLLQVVQQLRKPWSSSVKKR